MFLAVMFMLAQDSAYSVHGKLFPMLRETFNVAIYSFLGIYKIFWIVFNVIPYVALLIVQKKEHPTAL